MSGAPEGAFPVPSRYLRVNQTFTGAEQQEDGSECTTVIKFEKCDIEKGEVDGCMKEYFYKKGVDNTTDLLGKFRTIWRGEIVDNRKWGFRKSAWDKDWSLQREQWNCFPEFHPLSEEVEKNGGASLDLENSPYTFMRWRHSVVWNITPNGETSFEKGKYKHYAILVKSTGLLMTLFKAETGPPRLIHCHPEVSTGLND